MIDKYYQIKDWVFANPKKVYKYSMIVILISFLFTTLQYIFFPPDFKVQTLVPSMYSKSDDFKAKEQMKEIEMGRIVKEMQALKKKSTDAPLSNADSIRLKYLYNEYQKVKNGL